MKTIIARAMVTGSLWWASGVAACAEQPGKPVADVRPSASSVFTNRWTPVTSHSRTFIVTAMPRRDALEVALWAETVRERLTAWTGRTLPVDKMFPLVIAAELQPEGPRGWVKRAQDVTSDGRLRQEMTLVNPALMDQEDALETLCGLLINRYTFADWRAHGRKQGPLPVPDWMAVGVAQQVYPELVERNLAALKQAEQAGFSFVVEDLFHLKTLPPGRWPEKAQAALVTGWLGDAMGTEALFALFTEQLARCRPVTAADLMPRLGMKTMREMNMGWEVWLAGQDRKIRPGILSRDAVAIERVLAAVPEDAGILLPGPHADKPLLPDLLLGAREQPWARAAARRLSLMLGEATAGKAPELTAIAGDFLRVLREVADRGPRHKPMGDRELAALFASARARLDRYILDEKARGQVLDAFNLPQVEADPDGPEALRKMLDQRDLEP